MIFIYLYLFIPYLRASQVALVMKNPPANVGDIRDVVRSLGWVNPWVGMIPWRRAWQATPVFLPGESHGQGSEL